MRITAHVIPWSSVVGTGIILVNEAGAPIATMPLRGFSPDLPREEWKRAAIETAERMAAAINAGQPERRIHHPGRGHDYDVVASAALFQVSDTTTGVREVVDGDPVTVYRNEHGTFVRFPDEVVEPRFKEIKS